MHPKGTNYMAMSGLALYALSMAEITSGCSFEPNSPKALEAEMISGNAVENG